MNNQQITDTEDPEALFEHFAFTVDPGQEPMRIDRWLMHRIAHASRTKIQAAIDAGSVLVNEKSTKSNYKVKPKDHIRILLPEEPRDTEVYPENIPLNVVYEDDDIAIINKPAGMVVHPGAGNPSGTLVNALVYYFGQLPVKAENHRPGLVHRIDKNTTGLLVVAKSEHAMTHLAKQFYEHSIDRSYNAIAWGEMPEPEGTITGYIGRSNHDRKIFQLYNEEEKGKWSVTHYKVLQSLTYVSLIELKLETGRTHQIRVHAKSIGHPLFGDTTYGGDRILKGTTFTKYKQFVDNCFEILPRQALHARSLGFTHPVTGERMFFESPLPKDFVQVLDKWKNYAHFKPFEEE
jgi:23S rRNA pseudouridine1911/1915/1917 synthase